MGLSALFNNSHFCDLCVLLKSKKHMKLVKLPVIFKVLRVSDLV